MVKDVLLVVASCAKIALSSLGKDSAWGLSLNWNQSQAYASTSGRNQTWSVHTPVPISAKLSKPTPKPCVRRWFAVITYFLLECAETLKQLTDTQLVRVFIGHRQLKLQFRNLDIEHAFLICVRSDKNWNTSLWLVHNQVPTMSVFGYTKSFDRYPECPMERPVGISAR